jgi:hypothetical protein
LTLPKRTSFLIALAVMFSASVFSQTLQPVRLDCAGLPLNEVLLEISTLYGMELSVDARLAGGCKVTMSKTFGSVEEAVDALAAYCELEVKRISGVYTFRPLPEKKQSPVYLYQGTITEAVSGEPLPFTAIMTNELSLIADADGRFSFRSQESEAQVRFRHLGYHLADTLVAKGNQLRIELVPDDIFLEEVIIRPQTDLQLASTGRKAGNVQLNDVSTRLIPGNNTNMIFNHLRLYPGIMAAGESTADFIIWGSYPGQNQVVFDGMTLFNSYGINDDIGRVNPLMVKNIEVHKGGYNVDVGDRIGGVVLVDGKSGNLNEIDGMVSVSNEMANAYLSIPVFNKTTTLQLAGRKSYYQLLDLNSIIEKRNGFYIVPEYDYGDGNFKLTTRFSNDDKMEISAMASGDQYTELLEREGSARYFRQLKVNSLQVNTAAQYLRNWKKGGITKLGFAQSYYRTENTSTISFRLNDAMGEDRDLNDAWSNPVYEYSVRMEHLFPAIKKQDIRLSVAYIRNRYEFESESESVFNDVDESLDRVSAYIKDDISVARKFNLEVGLKLDVTFPDKRSYFQPRITGHLDITETWKMNFGWGMYSQFLSKTPVLDLEGNRRVVWQTTDGDEIPVLKSMHSVFGLSYLSEILEVTVEGYYRTTDNLLRYVENRDAQQGIFRQGEGRAYGIDTYVKTRFAGHEFWVSYSVGKAEEKYGEVVGYREATHSQRHEVKTALVLNFKPVQFSFTNVFGSGFPNTTQNLDAFIYPNYNRLDVAFQYGVNIKKTRLETGISLLNILNQENVRLNQFAIFPDGTTATTSGVPFTPSVYVNFGF